MVQRICLSGLLIAVALMAAGCSHASTADEARLEAQRARYLLADEPLGAVGVLQAQQTVADEPAELVVLGRVGGVADPWTRGQAEFVIADPVLLLEADQHGDCSDGCAFCSKKKPSQDSAGLALVQFTDEQGRVLSLDARQLFGLTASQMVVVRGRAKRDNLGNLTVSATGLYIRR